MKKALPDHPPKLRPITILPVIMKLYMAVLISLESDNLQNRSPFQFAFREHFQCHDVVFILRNLIEKFIEWRSVLGDLYALDGDISRMPLHLIY